MRVVVVQMWSEEIRVYSEEEAETGCDRENNEHDAFQ